MFLYLDTSLCNYILKLKFELLFNNIVICFNNKIIFYK